MTVTATPTPQPNNSDGVVNYASGGMTTDASAAAAYSVNLGFVPRKVRIVNLTDLIQYEKLDQMAATDTLKTVTAGTFTKDTGTAISIGTNAAGTENTVTFSAGVMLASKSFAWEAFA